ncbi:flagellar basal body P-ring protein FlgI [Limisalsivibrio acetivorans]|uniref:flagellar basal body P-ring protein FlgI n=1 Tax=Limisalsivibrio acetivorans TaxID=1304888 RepID=UPI0003B5A3AD|nr:flagellar basal body P-ring protein FlgI [Limisalsivibrio acetivorans]
MRKAFVILIILLTASASWGNVKIRDLTSVEGIRDNQILGYGLIVGLNGTGDKTGTQFTIQSMVNMLERMGITVDKDQVKVKNVAAVMVTAKLPPFAKPGSKIDVVVSSIGDANSLEGGTLLMTPLSGANGEVYAVAQGPISVGGMNVSAGGASATKNHPTVGMIPNGGLVEQSVSFKMNTDHFNLAFDDYNLSNVVKAKSAINAYIGAEVASIQSPTSLRVDIPEVFRESFYDFLDTVLSIQINPASQAKVVVDERTGTIVMGSDVRLSTVAVSHGNLTITISSTVEAERNLLNPEEENETQNTDIEVTEEDSNLMIVPEGVSISDLVKALNSIGVTPRDLISVLQAIKAAGALHGDLEVM